MITASPGPSARSQPWSAWRRTVAPSGSSKTGSTSAGTPAVAVGYAVSSKPLSSVNSQPVTPLNCGSSSVSQLANGALHLKLDQAVHLDRVLHRELLDDRLDEPVDDQLRGLFLVDAVRLQVEELLLADLRDGGLVADVDVVLADPDRRVRVRARLWVEQQRVADDLRLRAVGALGDLEQAAVRTAPAVLRDRLGEDVRGRVRGGVDDLAARVLVLAVAGERDRQDLAMGALAHQVDAWVLHRELRAEVAVDPLDGRVGVGPCALGDQVEHVVRPVLDGRVADSRARLGEQLDDGGMEAVARVRRRRAALDVVH